MLVDDLVDTAGTLCKGGGGAEGSWGIRVVAYCTHAVLSGPAVTNIESSKLDELVVTSTIPLREDAAACSKIRQLVDRRPVGRIDSPDQQRGIGQFAVRGLTVIGDIPEQACVRMVPGRGLRTFLVSEESIETCRKILKLLQCPVAIRARVRAAACVARDGTRIIYGGGRDPEMFATRHNE